MASLAEIITRVQRRVIDLPSAVQAEVQALVGKAHREIQERHSFDVMERRISRVTTAFNPSLGAIGTDNFKEYMTGNPPFWTDELGDTQFLQVCFNEGDVRAMFNQDADLGKGEPRVLLHRHQAASDAPAGIEWKVYPVPDGLAQTATGEYTIQIPYWRYIPLDSQHDWFTDHAEWYLVAKATADAFYLNWDPAQAGLWEQVAEREFRRLTQRDKMLKVSHVETLVPHVGALEPKLRL